jgi:hypothetical protein
LDLVYGSGINCSVGSGHGRRLFGRCDGLKRVRSGTVLTLRFFTLRLLAPSLLGFLG